MLTIYDAPRCPYCARVRIQLAEKDIEHELVPLDLDERPDFIKALNPPSGRVPVLVEEGFVLPESPVIMEYLEERFPEPSLLPADPESRALARLLVFRFADYLGDPYYDLYFDRPTGSADQLSRALTGLEARLSTAPYLAGAEYSLADIAYVPWIYRIESRLRFDLSPYPAIREWAERVAERPAVAAERDVVAALFRR
ncbi:MAG: glutathione S-transferase family protein [Gaiellales bacterium]